MPFGMSSADAVEHAASDTDLRDESGCLRGLLRCIAEPGDINVRLDPLDCWLAMLPTSTMGGYFETYRGLFANVCNSTRSGSCVWLTRHLLKGLNLGWTGSRRSGAQPK